MDSLTKQEIEALAKSDFKTRRDLTNEGIYYLLDVRITGLTLLNKLGKELKTYKLEDKEWYLHEHTKPGYLQDFNGLEENFKEVYQEQKEDVKTYVSKHLDFFLSAYSKDTLLWIDDWYYLWSNRYDLNDGEELLKKKLDYQLYFSLLDPRPPTIGLISFGTIWPHLLKRITEKIRPQYLEDLWNSEKTRNAILLRQPDGIEERIVSYEKAYQYVVERMGKELKLL